jgi:hypothetical protein
VRKLVPGCSVSDPDPFQGVLGSGSVSYSNKHNKINWKRKFNKVCLLLGLVGPTDKENQVKMYKKYCFRYIISLKWQGSGSVSNSRIRICIKLNSRIRIRINRVWIHNTAVLGGMRRNLVPTILCR